MVWYQIVGWVGVSAILLAYTFITFDQLAIDHLLYVTLNGGGALALIIQSYMIRNYQLIVLNVVWCLVAVAGLVQYLLQ